MHSADLHQNPMVAFLLAAVEEERHLLNYSLLV
jgi:hypothetical protein